MRPAVLLSTTIVCMLIYGLAWGGEDPVQVEYAQPLPRPQGGLGSTWYIPTAAEKEATKNWNEGELASGSMNVGSLAGPLARRVAWFGIIRDLTEDDQTHETRLLVEMQYFDGLTDIHQQIVSIYGAGDFRAVVPGTGHKFKKLGLVRICGKVVGEKEGLPVVASAYLRYWEWGLFAFMAYGEDKNKPAWTRLRKVDPDDAYSSDPDPAYYEQRLGKR